MCRKIEKLKDLHQILESDKSGRFYAELLKLSNKLHKCKLQKNCQFVLHYFQATELAQDISEVCAKFQRVSVVQIGEF